MALTKFEIRILVDVLQRMEKSLYNYEECVECGTIHEVDPGHEWNVKMEIIDHPSNRQIAVAMERYVIGKHQWDKETMLFEAGHSRADVRRKMIYFDVCYMFEYLLHRLKEESK